ncbi:hypothetical protein [Flavobacterium sp. PL02]|uniref:hypothetical protein n=1 Tax=Flavobacterium sp. PL02 TaxID=3088354 RepID=UPI002B22FA96|nr:hypothetical protein [Flavobacterium sp. PL02]MEA9415072.1 hypothetical protein [Flavobacterium sp. PL02]
MKKINILVTEMLNETSSKKISKIRDKIIQLVNSYENKKINIDTWKNSVEYRIENRGLEIPRNVNDIIEIINIVRILELSKDNY